MEKTYQKPYKLKENVREYLDYPSKMEFAIFYQNDRLATKMFNWECQPVEN